MTFISAQLNQEKLRKLGLRGPAMTKVVTQSLAAGAKTWHSEFLGEHFKMSAFRRYGYLARRGQTGDQNSKHFRDSYSGRKLRTKGHMLPLVFSGLTKNLSAWPDIRANGKLARVVLPRGFNRKNPHSRINMREEITTILPSESKTMVRTVAESTKNQLRDMK